MDRGAGQPREFLQAGLELIGVPGPEGEAEVIALTLAALDEAGLRRHRVGLGDGALYRALLRALEVPEESHTPLLERLSRRDLVGLELRGRPSSASADAERDLLVAAARAARRARGARPRPTAPAAGPLDGLRALLRSARPSAAWPTG